MDILLNDYKRRLTSVNQLIEKNTNNGSINDIQRDTRLKTKASEYRAIITEIERAMARRTNERSSLVLHGVIKSVCTAKRACLFKGLIKYCKINNEKCKFAQTVL